MKITFLTVLISSAISLLTTFFCFFLKVPEFYAGWLSASVFYMCLLYVMYLHWKIKVKAKTPENEPEEQKTDVEIHNRFVEVERKQAEYEVEVNRVLSNMRNEYSVNHGLCTERLKLLRSKIVGLEKKKKPMSKTKRKK